MREMWPIQFGVKVVLIYCLSWIVCPNSRGTENVVLATFDISANSDLIILPVTVAGAEYRFMLNSSASHHIFDSSLQQHMGKHITTAKIGTGEDAPPIEIFASPKVMVGTLPLIAEKHVGMTDLLPMRQVAGEDICGVIGIEFFLSNVVRIDFDKRKLSVLRKGVRGEDWGEPIRLAQDADGRASFHAKVGSLEDISLLVDTGSNFGINLASHVFRYLREHGELEAVGTTRGRRISETSNRSIGCLTRFRCGPFAHSDVFVSDSASSFCGLAYLSRYTVTFDFAENRMYLKPGSRYRENEREYISGLHLLLIDQAITVHSVDPETAAARAGIQKGDVVTSVDMMPVDALRLQGIRRKLNGAGGDVVTLRLRRAKRTFTVRLMLQQLPCGSGIATGGK